MLINWQKCQGDVWGSLAHVDLSHSHFDNMEGVYIIWQANGPVVRVGQGIIRDRLNAHRNDKTITAYPSLQVTWAPVIALYRDGVEHYLADALKPVVGDKFPNVVPISIPLPWPW
jgi:hypothetical protein